MPPTPHTRHLLLTFTLLATFAPLAACTHATQHPNANCPNPVYSKPQPAVASWYGPGLQGNTTANGERFNMHDLTAAHKKLPFHTVVRVTYQNRSVDVRINDRGPFVKGRDIDLSKAAAEKIGMLRKGVANVTIQIRQKCR